MKTKIQIIQSLLDDRKITAEEALTLMATEKEYVYYPNYPIFQPYVTQPYFCTSGGDNVEITSVMHTN